MNKHKVNVVHVRFVWVQQTFVFGVALSDVAGRTATELSILRS